MINLKDFPMSKSVLGRPKKLSKREEYKLVFFTRKNKKLSIRKIATKFSDFIGKDISRTIVSKTLKKTMDEYVNILPFLLDKTILGG